MSKEFMSNESMNNDFRVGDTVWCTAYGKGVVIDTDSSIPRDYPVTVSFTGLGVKESYTKEGAMFKGGDRCLFFSKPTVTGQTERPFVPELLGKNVIVLSKSSNEILGQGKVTHENNKSITVDWKVDNYAFKCTNYIKEEIFVVVIDNKNIIKFD